MANQPDMSDPLTRQIVMEQERESHKAAIRLALANIAAPDPIDASAEGATAFADFNGNPVKHGLLYVFEAGIGSMTPKPTYRDRERRIANRWPVVLDRNGCAAIFLEPGPCRIKLTRENGDPAIAWYVEV